MASRKDGLKIKNEIDTDPLARNYAGMSDLEVSEDMHLVNRPGPGTVEQLRVYFILEKKNNTALYGRLAEVARSKVGDDPIDEATPLTLEHTTSALTMLNILNPESLFRLDLNDTRFDGILDDLAAGQGCKVITPGHKTAIQNMSVNVRDRAQELGISDSSEGAITYARGLS